MAQIGCLGDIAFTVSSSVIKTISKVQWSGSARYGEHQRHLAKTLLEFTGTAPDAISFEMILSVFLGVKPSEEIEKLRAYQREGVTVPLVIGDTQYGDYRWVVQEYKVKMDNFDRHGNLIGATVSVNLTEYIRA